MSLPPLWRWQERGLDRVIDLLDGGHLAVCRQLPTGMGKTREQLELARTWLDRGRSVLLYVNQRQLTHQTGAAIVKAGMVPGFLAAGFDGPLSDLRVCSVQTVRRRHSENLPECDLAIIDECHRRDFDFVVESYRARGTAVVGYSATPVGLAGKYQTMVLEGDKVEGRAAGALVKCYVYAPTEPDMKGVKMTRLGEYQQGAAAKRIMQCTCFADVFETYVLRNPDRWPTLLWAPGIPESRWFCEQFQQRGITALHLDGDTPDDERQRIMKASRAGEAQVVSSFGVLREGVDMPWIRYGILVQVCGAMSTFDQLSGRLLRGFPEGGKEFCILQDHAGAWHRHGSPNEDRAWQLGDTDRQIAKSKKEARESGDLAEPVRCPKCGGIRLKGPRCPHCGYEHTRSVRAVRMESGELKRVVGFTVKKKKKVNEEQKIWTGCLFAAGSRGMTVRQAFGMFYAKTQRGVPPDCRPQPPPDHLDWMRKVSDVYPGFCRKRQTQEAAT